jgi:polysaccharide export outer membrane protein
MRVFALLLILSVTGLAGCSTSKFVGRPGLELVVGDLPPPARQDLLLQQRSYLIGPLDKVTIDVYGVSELSRTTQIEADGTLSLPLVGTLQAMGRSSTELAQMITDKLRGRYVRDPQVTVSVDTVSQTITVDGEVNKPGLYPVNGRLTLMRAISQAQGVGEFADLSYVTVYRQVNDKQMAALYDVRAIRQGMYPDPDVYANDFVLVGEDRGARTFRTLIQGSGLLAAPLVALLQR